MWNLELRGYDSLYIGGEIKMPDVFTMAMQPMFINADFSVAYENSGPIVRDLLERVPLKGGYKYTMVSSLMNFLSPRTSSIQNAHWHLDPGVPAPHKHDARLHILSSGYDLTATTKFIKNDMTVEMPDELYDARHRALRTYITNHAEEWGFEETAVPANRFVTFTNLHPHIALPPTKYELRYFLRIQESNIEPPRDWAQQYYTGALVDMRDDSRMVTTFQQREDGIFLKTDIEGDLT